MKQHTAQFTVDPDSMSQRPIQFSTWQSINSIIRGCRFSECAHRITSNDVNNAPQILDWKMLPTKNSVTFFEEKCRENGSLKQNVNKSMSFLLRTMKNMDFCVGYSAQLSQPDTCLYLCRDSYSMDYSSYCIDKWMLQRFVLFRVISSVWGISSVLLQFNVIIRPPKSEW